MSDVHFLVSHENPDHVKPILFPAPSVAINPALRRLREFPLFFTMHGFDGITERITAARFYLYKRDHSIPLHHEIDIAVAGTISPRDRSPSTPLEPARSDAFAEFTEVVRCVGHSAMIARTALATVTELFRGGANG
jgi:hypothetical protein